MEHFSMNGDEWTIQFVDADDPMLVDRTKNRTVATTDPKTKNVYLSNKLYGDFLIKVLLHELGHCALESFNLVDDIHRMVLPKYWIEAEEWVCNFIADYGLDIFSAAFSAMGHEAWKYIPFELEKLLADDGR